MSDMPSPVIVQVQHAFHVSAERVYDAWLDPSVARRFLFATAGGNMLRADIDPHVGGSFVLTERRPKPDGSGTDDVAHIGTYLELARPRRIVFTFSVPQYSAAMDRVAIDIARQGRGCALELTHEMQPEAALYAERAREGWRGILATLAAVLDDLQSN